MYWTGCPLGGGAQEQGKIALFQARQAGRPLGSDNAMIETFNAKVRAECLDQHWFESLEEDKEQLEEWRKEYNRERPHSSLNNLTPDEYLARWRAEKQLEKAGN